MSESEFRKLPSVDDLLGEATFPDSLPDPLKTRIVRSVVGESRERIKEGGSCPSEREIRDRVQGRARAMVANRVQSVINATGVVLHTNLGRAPYSEEAVSDLSEVTGGYSSLEMDLDSGGRGGRGAYAETLLTELTGADSAMIVNNCSAALVLTLKALAEGAEVVISRGELVQIGGGFRIPEILEVSGATLREVGTTNRTDLEDYRDALDDRTGMILRVHRSNFDVVGFTEAPDTDQLRELADRADVPLVVDLGSGALVNTDDYGLRHEPRPGEVLDRGADLVMFSGDKLLGGPQAGIILGAEPLVERLRNHPLFRALRVGKSTLTTLETVLDAYATNRADELPVYEMFDAPVEELRDRADALVDRLGSPDIELTVADMDGTVGGGALPSEEIPSAGLELGVEEPERTLTNLRNAAAPVIGRIRDDRVQLNLRTVRPGEDDRLLSSLQSALETDS